MELYREILAAVLEKEEVHVLFPALQISATAIVKMQCYEALLKIKAIIENDNLDDFECVDRIVTVFEDIGGNIEGRHDFG